MKTLLLMRHGKSSWGTASDEERPLSDRGRREAERMGRWLAIVDRVPDRVVCSPAVRALATARSVVEAGGLTCPIDVDPRIYDADPSALMEVIASTDESVSCPLLVGHEPGLSGVMGHLLGGGVVRFDTAAGACMDLDVDRWAELEGGCGVLLWLVPPTVLPGR